MASLIFIVITIALLAGFFVLSDYETQRGSRFFSNKRDHFDGKVEQAEFVLIHVDLAAFLREEVRTIMKCIIHDIAHFSLKAVRAIERLLTRIVRRLRMERIADTPPRENAREFVKNLSDFKDQLKETPPEIPDIY